MTSPAGGEAGTLRGIFDDFGAYRTVSDEDMRAALRGGLVVIDANVLLNLYRYDETARSDLLKVLRALKGRLFVPHQVSVEFWRNRESAILDRSRTARDTAEALETIRNDAQGTVRTWANRLAVPDPLREELLSTIQSAFESVTSSVRSSAGSDAETRSHDTAADQLLSDLEDVLDEAIGVPLDPDAYRQAVSEGLRRVEQRIPPGFKDKGKEGDGPAGDYLVWHQSLLEAKRRSADALVFVTGDTAGDDWWRKERGELRGPRIELYAEANEIAGAKLYLVRPQTLVLHAQEALKLEIGSQTVATIERVQQSSQSTQAETQAVVDAIRDFVWSADKPPVSSAVANAALLADPALTETAWAGTGSFRSFLRTFLPDLRFVLPPQPGYVMDPQRHSASDIPRAYEEYSLSVAVDSDGQTATINFDIKASRVQSVVARVTWPSGFEQDSYPVAVPQSSREGHVRIIFPNAWPNPPAIEDGRYVLELWEAAPFRRYEAGVQKSVLSRLFGRDEFSLSVGRESLGIVRPDRRDDL